MMHSNLHQRKSRKDAIGWTTIRVRDETMAKLEELRNLDQSFDSVIMHLIQRNKELE